MGQAPCHHQNALPLWFVFLFIPGLSMSFNPEIWQKKGEGKELLRHSVAAFHISQNACFCCAWGRFFRLNHDIIIENKMIFRH